MPSFLKKLSDKFSGLNKDSENQERDTLSCKPVKLKDFVNSLETVSYRLEGEEIDPALASARWGDLCRKLAFEAPTQEDFELVTVVLDDEGWHRMDLVINALNDESLHNNLKQLCAEQTTTQLIEKLCDNLAKGLELLPIELLNLSPIRMEEFARNTLHQINTPIDGETPQESREKLKNIDYKRLLGEAQKAQQSAEERLAELRRIQEEERAAFERSKW